MVLRKKLTYSSESWVLEIEGDKIAVYPRRTTALGGLKDVEALRTLCSAALGDIDEGKYAPLVLGRWNEAPGDVDMQKELESDGD
jgi:hypothetical protein